MIRPRILNTRFKILDWYLKIPDWYSRLLPVHNDEHNHSITQIEMNKNVDVQKCEAYRLRFVEAIIRSVRAQQDIFSRFKRHSTLNQDLA